MLQVHIQICHSHLRPKSEEASTDSSAGQPPSKELAARLKPSIVLNTVFLFSLTTYGQSHHREKSYKYFNSIARQTIGTITLPAGQPKLKHYWNRLLRATQRDFMHFWFELWIGQLI